MELTRVERWILANQYRILEKLIPNEAEDFARAQVILSNGYERDYDELANHISEEGFPRDASEEVLNILEMFRALKRSYDELSDKSDINQYGVTFQGFDGNNEHPQLAYASHFCEQGRFAELNVVNVNSHSQVLDGYRRMLRQWELVGKKQQLSKDEIKQITEGRPIAGDDA